MLDKNLLVKVTNRTHGSLGYTIQDLGVRRHYEPNETKEVSLEELQKLSYSVGGRAMLEEDLFIDNQEIVDMLLNGVEPEYYYSKEDIDVLLTEGSLDQLLDCLDFAPEGVIDIVKGRAVELEVADLSKRKAIEEKTGLNISKAIEINHESKMDGIDIDTSSARQRRAAPVTESTPQQPTRRYNVVK